MSITEEQRNEKIANLDEVYKALYTAPQSGKIMYAAFSKYELEEDQYLTYSRMVGDTILGFYKTTDLPRLFQSELNVSADDAQRLMSELIEFLSPVVDSEQSITNIKKEDIDKLAKTFEKSAKDRPREVQPEGKPTDVQPLRTMQGDMNRVHGYGAITKQDDSSDEPLVKAASQEEIVTGKPAPTPSQKPTPAPPPVTKTIEPDVPSPTSAAAPPATPAPAPVETSISTAQDAINQAAAAVAPEVVRTETPTDLSPEDTVEVAPEEVAGTQSIPVRKVD